MSEGTTVHPELMTKLHELLELALHDMELFEQQPDCHVDMDTWLRPGWPDEGENPKHCYACLAGTVWRMTLGLEDTPSATAPNWANALNQLRYGRVSDAYFYLPGWEKDENDRDVRYLNRIVWDYHSSRVHWWKAMRKLLADLKEADV